jgi:hypothetical protein
MACCILFLQYRRVHHPRVRCLLQSSKVDSRRGPPGSSIWPLRLWTSALSGKRLQRKCEPPKRLIRLPARCALTAYSTRGSASGASRPSKSSRHGSESDPTCPRQSRSTSRCVRLPISSFSPLSLPWLLVRPSGPLLLVVRTQSFRRAASSLPRCNGDHRGMVRCKGA